MAQNPRKSTSFNLNVKVLEKLRKLSAKHCKTMTAVITELVLKAK